MRGARRFYRKYAPLVEVRVESEMCVPILRTLRAQRRNIKNK